LRDLYFFLDTPVEAPMEWIFRRISDDHPEITYGRDHWLHLHEHEESLRFLDQKFRETLHMAQAKAPFKIVEIDAVNQNEEQVSKLMCEYSTNFCNGYPFEKWVRI
jgi:hypothetical protein